MWYDLLLSSFLVLFLEDSSRPKQQVNPSPIKKIWAHELIVVNPAASAHYHLPKQTKESWIVQVSQRFWMLYLYGLLEMWKKVKTMHSQECSGGKEKEETSCQMWWLLNNGHQNLTSLGCPQKFRLKHLPPLDKYF